MLNKSNRLLTKQFNGVVSKGRVFHSSLFLVRTLPGQVDTRVAAVAPAKIYKKAAERNRAKRLVYNALKPPLFPTKAGTHTIIFAKDGVLKAGPEDISTDLKALFVKSGLLK